MSRNNSEEQRNLVSQPDLDDRSIHEEYGIDDNVVYNLPEGLIPNVDSDSTDDDDSDIDLGNLRQTFEAFPLFEDEGSVETPEPEQLQEQPFIGPLNFQENPSDSGDEAIAGPPSGSTQGQSSGGSQIVGDGGQNNTAVCPVCQELVATSAELRNRWTEMVARITSLEDDLRF